MTNDEIEQTIRDANIGLPDFQIDALVRRIGAALDIERSKPGIASQDYRDGATWGAHELGQRLRTITVFGFPLSVPNVELAAKQIQYEMGGRLPTSMDASEES